MHLAPDFLRAEVNRLTLGVPPPAQKELESTAAIAIGAEISPHGPPVVQAPPEKTEGPELAPISRLNSGPSVERRTGFEPATLSLGS